MMGQNPTLETLQIKMVSPPKPGDVTDDATLHGPPSHTVLPNYARLWDCRFNSEILL